MYAVGAMLYELLTERPLARHDRARNVGAGQDAPSLSRRRNWCRACRATTETICLKCLEKEPGKRYASAADLAGDLGRYLAGEPIVAPAGEESRACGQVGTARTRQLPGYSDSSPW